ncbi:MAG: hypothetical protein RMK00_09495 [Bacteroidota bacterium]|nr:hypothetical protein [Candidatus Kapabacteria bacterium]MDW8075986.1 hypothetical protein [Bacteroidota bacterium]
MKLALIAAMSVMVGLLLAGCKSESSGPTTGPEIPAELFPLKPGNYWVYVVYALDTNGLRRGIERYDSVVVGEMSRVADRQAYPLYFFRTEDPTSGNYQLHDSSYAVVDASNNVWMYNLAGSASNIPLSWWRITGTTPWVVVDTTFAQGGASIRLKITGNKEGTEPYSVGGNTFTSQKFTHVWEATVASGGNTINVRGSMRFWFVPKIGLVGRYFLVKFYQGGLVDHEGEDYAVLRYRVQ